MPAHFIGELILLPILECILYVFSYGTGYLLLNTFSLGKIKLASLTSYQQKKRGKKKWYQIDWSIWLHRKGKGKQLKAEVTCLVGILFWLAILIGAVVVASHGDDEGEEIEKVEVHSG